MVQSKEQRNDNIDESAAACLNCGELVKKSYCSNCGQAVHIHRSLGAIWHDFLHGVLHFDGKFWRTMPMLILRPGVLTRDYIAGKRAQYISPMALFLFSIFMMFAVFSFVGPTIADLKLDDIEGIEEFAFQTEEEISQEIKRIEDDIAAGKIVDEEGRSNVDKLKEVKNYIETFNKGVQPSSVDESDTIMNQEDIIQINNLEDAFAGDKAIQKRVEGWIDLINNNTELLWYKMKSSGYKFSWLLIPISLPFVWIAMVGVRGHPLYDHAIFTIYSMSFVTILFIILVIMGSIGFLNGWLVPAGIIVPIIHLYKQIRHGYQLSRRQTFLRLIILCIGIVFSLLIFFAILLLMGILG